MFLSFMWPVGRSLRGFVLLVVYCCVLLIMSGFVITLLGKRELLAYGLWTDCHGLFPFRFLSLVGYDV